MNLDQLSCTLANVNVRREKAGDEQGPVAVDLKFQGEAHPDALKEMFATGAGFDTVLGSLFDEDGEMASHDVDSIRLTRTAVGHSCTIETGLNAVLELETVDADKVVLLPKDGPVVAYSFRVKFKPSPEQLGEISKLLEQQVKLTLARKQSELDLKKPEKKKGGKKAQPDQPELGGFSVQ